ncbi:hypothetical protein [Streptomyces sp. NPDC102462]|uniref:hypothetical protein n=1 Tax=Streptomyces sp. NPDC102462 TaxID=3366178 RepID=UPI0038263977
MPARTHFVHGFEKGLVHPSTTPRGTPDASCRHAHGERHRGFAAVPGLITRVTDAAGGAPLAASANVSASNVGNALGAWLGGLTIGAGLGYRSPLYAGAALTLAGLAVLTYAARTASRAA